MSQTIPQAVREDVTLKCSLTPRRWCRRLDERLEPEANANRKGLVLFVLFDINTGENEVVAAVFKTSGKDRGLILNFCPWCGEKIFDDVKYKTKHAVDDPAAEARHG